MTAANENKKKPMPWWMKQAVRYDARNDPGHDIIAITVVKGSMTTTRLLELIEAGLKKEQESEKW
ncbi:hypothetical protein VF14_18540 [Nostoc linckia z18]|uniref:Uncharacterized protein n=2 Tax=Nostoc linckia TaxID=92942 RepID=A0A9Q5Z593_NOSLI|nr:hypothetical protein [Nostoc linckia]PHJ50695.1 hypothetical protein VF02_38080 [Nostoc linckia z1]PHJ81999.1 hypothetical protein VF07_29360 [Nostoc linckia z6]PHJ83736.1 hypothetical protein VF04_36560 [Nostoc linckia z7]PHJ94036.1 hypothetical protein VF08_34470 [Nostoc linckia z8]PHK09343.1 hypothetical protein VF09_16135 [Nostoc linckia z9]